MIAPEVRAHVLRLHRVENWKIQTIARQVRLHHSTVRRILNEAGEHEAATSSARPRLIDPYVPFVRETLSRYPDLCASRLYLMVKERGYTGGPDHFRSLVACERPRPAAEAYLRLSTLPGEQAQVDWGHFGTVTIGRAVRVLSAFVMVLSYSRQLYFQFFYGQNQSAFLWGHQGAFDRFGGVPRVLLYDNLKSVVLERQAEAIRFHPNLLRFAAHYGYEPRPVAVARGNEKGRVERAIRYIRTTFFAARTFSGLEDLNEQAHEFCRSVSAQRRLPNDPTQTVQQAFEHERSRLLSLPENPYPTDECVCVHVGKTPYVRFDKNDYSVPFDRVRRSLEVRADRKTVRIREGTQLLAAHARSWDQGQQIEDPEHIQALVERKAEARTHRGLNYLSRTVPKSKPFLEQLAQRGGPLGSATAALLRLLAHYGPAELQIAIEEALERGTPHPHSVHHILERRRRAANEAPPIPIPLPADGRLHVAVVPHDLSRYDTKNPEDVDDDEIF